MSKKNPSLPGFKTLSDQVLLREADSVGSRPSHHPAVVAIYGWGDGQPRHVSKYADGYRQLFPHSAQILVISPIAKAMFQDHPKRTEAMIPVVDIFDAVIKEHGADDVSSTPILVHAMSNTGAMNYASTLKGFQERHNRPLPHQLLVLDSTPGNPWMSWEALKRWSRAMAIGSASHFPWPFFVTQFIWAMVLGAYSFFQWLVGREAPSVFSLRTVNDDRYATKDAHRLCMYSKEDDLILWEDLEFNAAEARGMGYDVSLELFEGSGHVGHMRKFPERYWDVIGQTWEKAKKEA